MDGWISWRGDAAKLADHARPWNGIHAIHLSVNTLGAGLGGMDGHLGARADGAGALAAASLLG